MPRERRRVPASSNTLRSSSTGSGVIRRWATDPRSSTNRPHRPVTRRPPSLGKSSPSSSHCRRTLKAGWPCSTSGRLCSHEDGSFFFEPLQLHLQPADLLEQLGLSGLGVRRGRLGLGGSGEEALGPGQELLLPAVDQRRVDAVVAGQFV